MPHPRKPQPTSGLDAEGSPVPVQPRKPRPLEPQPLEPQPLEPQPLAAPIPDGAVASTVRPGAWYYPTLKPIEGDDTGVDPIWQTLTSDQRWRSIGALLDHGVKLERSFGRRVPERMLRHVNRLVWITEPRTEYQRWQDHPRITSLPHSWFKRIMAAQTSGRLAVRQDLQIPTANLESALKYLRSLPSRQYRHRVEHDTPLKRDTLVISGGQLLRPVSLRWDKYTIAIHDGRQWFEMSRPKPVI